MSSGISTEADRLKPAPPGSVDAGLSRPADGFHAWHFFVLASILLATGAVFVTRGSSPEQLILISLTVAAAGGVAAAFYRMLLPLMSSYRTVGEEPLNERRRATLEREKMLTLRSIKELEFDRAMGKLSDKDFEEMATRLRQRAIVLMRELDQGGYAAVIERELQDRLRGAAGSGGSARSAGTAGSCACGTLNDVDAVFCKKCGSRLQTV